MQATRKRFSVPEYHRMQDAGILTAGDRVELIDGEIVDVSPIGKRHAAVITRLTRLLTTALLDDALVRVQLPIVLGDWSEPEPDVAVVRPRGDFYSGNHPTSEDILLIVEVSDSTLDFDRGVKVPLYAAHGVQEVWIADLRWDALIVFHDLDSGAYRVEREFERGDSVSALGLPGHDLLVDDILPERMEPR